MLREVDGLPGEILGLEASELHRVLPGPTLIHLPGRRPEPLFVSILLHGNETTGWEAMRALLREYTDRVLPRALSIFIGNVTAARERLRVLPEQPDFNRIWAGGNGPEEQMATRIRERMVERRVFASIDIHNNTGLNPHYGCINVLDQRFLHLATLFSRTVVYFIRPRQVQSLAFSEICPAITVECGKVGDALGIEHARRLVEAALHLDHFPQHPVAPHDYDLYHTVATVKIPPAVDFGFGDTQARLRFAPDLDRLNFRELASGTVVAEVAGEAMPVEAWDEAGANRADDYFAVDEGLLRLRRTLMPSMLTLDASIIRQDCLCYLMERLPPIMG